MAIIVYLFQQKSRVSLVHHLDMTTQEVTVGKQRTIDVVLKDDSEMLDEVVVVGYGTMKKSDLTGACLPIVQTKRR